MSEPSRKSLGMASALLATEQQVRRAVLASELDRLATLEAALRTIQSSIPGYLKQKMTAEDFALIVIGAVDSKAVNSAMRKADAS